MFEWVEMIVYWSGDETYLFVINVVGVVSYKLGFCKLRVTFCLTKLSKCYKRYRWSYEDVECTRMSLAQIEHCH